MLILTMHSLTLSILPEEKNNILKMIQTGKSHTQEWVDIAQGILGRGEKNFCH